MFDNLDIAIADPVWITGTFEQNINQYNSYSHTINAVGGMWSANLSIPVSRVEAEDWFMDGLGRDVTVTNTALETVFNGFVNKITVNIGTFTTERGPLMDVANQVAIVYSTIDTTTDPPILGIREITTNATDSTSQTKYGVISKVLSTGGATATTAEQIRDTFLEENKDPQTSQNITIGGTGQPGTLTLQILGYAHFLSLYTYNSTTTGTRTYSLRIQDILGADPNSIFSTDYSKISTNSATVPRYDNDDRKGWAVIKDVLAKGDSSYNRYLFGIYESRQAEYSAIPTEVEYYHQIADPKQRILTGSNAEIDIWDIRPGKWLQVTDWLVGRSGRTIEIRDDQRNMFIESVTYSTPDALQIKGIKVATMPQLLGKLGLSGIGA